ncbi:Meiosis-specific serine/threonine-protein kinase mek1 [Lachnellula arida]|uniref:Meiosis-specific serine/threonine-protein kinase mek1 n=1 Tax=Lachnellula arida TaxID=1316785 RepID=A0A8T9B8M9_9HELO|nr:Meiosis-specific serine/threonine-protein kinase mek1 [Lachnellula arida]
MAEGFWSSSSPDFPQSDAFNEDSNHDNSIAYLQCTDKEGRDNSHERSKLAETPRGEFSVHPPRRLLMKRSNHLIPDSRVSKRHFRIYSIIYEAGRSDLPPLVYCEDLESSNGTYVNDGLIGIIGQERRGFLLNDGDIIEIRPGWTFQFHQSVHDIVTRDIAELNDLQHFQDRFSVSDRILGEGSYGAVYLAQDLSQDLASKKQVACKIINLKASTEKQMEQRHNLKAGELWHNQLRRATEGRNITLREIRILSKLSHPHIINLKKAFCTTASLYIITELAPGGDLFSYLESYGGHLDDWHGRVVARQLALAIEYLHSKRIAHRDIKPENVLVSHTDFGGRIILTDFGFANAVDAKTGRLQSIVGTTGFVAPEVEGNHRKEGYTLAADLWSLGVLTACVLTGNSLIPHRELSRLSQVEIASRFLEIDDGHTRDQWISMGPRAQRFLRRLLTTDPANRMTATEALNHSWFKKPHSEGALLEDRYHKIIRFWKERDSDDQVIEYLPSWNQTPEAEQEKGPKFRRKFPDATFSPYFNLDRHLTQKRPATREEVLASLLESGSSFVPSKDFRHKPAARLATRKHRDMDAIFVDAKDMFRTSHETEVLNPIDDDDEMILVPTESMPRLEYLNLQSSAKCTEVPDSQAETQDDDEDQGRMIKRARKESWDLEDRRIHEAASLVVPPYASARVFRDTIRKRKEAERQKNTRPSLYAM